MFLSHLTVKNAKPWRDHWMFFFSLTVLSRGRIQMVALYISSSRCCQILHTWQIVLFFFFLMADTFCYFRCILTLDAWTQIWACVMDAKVYHVWFVWKQPFGARAWFWNCAWGHLKRWSCARFICARARSAGGVEAAVVKRVSVVFFIGLLMIFGELQMMVVVAVYIVHGCVRHRSTKQMLPSWWRKWFLLVCKITLVHTVPRLYAHAKMFRNETKLLIWKLSSGFGGQREPSCSHGIRAKCENTINFFPISSLASSPSPFNIELHLLPSKQSLKNISKQTAVTSQSFWITLFRHKSVFTSHTCAGGCIYKLKMTLKASLWAPLCLSKLCTFRHPRSPSWSARLYNDECFATRNPAAIHPKVPFHWLPECCRE